MKKHLLCSAMALAFADISLAAQQQDSMENMIVTATRTPVSVDKSLASVSLLTREDIENSQAESLTDLLRGLAGVETTTSGSRGAISRINVRGSESDHVLILIDGVRVSSATTGAVAVSQIPLAQIERIELVRGARSSLYGSDAVGGVLQIFTRRGSDAEIKPYVEVQVGSDNLSQVSAGVSGKVENTSFSFSASSEELDGFDSTVSVPGSPEDDDDDGYRENSFSASISHDLTESWSLDANILYSESDVDTDGGTKKDRSERVNQTVNLGVKGQLTDSLGLSVSVREAKTDLETFGSFASIYDTERNGATAQLDYAIDEQNLITVGYDYYDDEVVSNRNYAQNERYNKAMFAQYQYSGDLFSLAASLRQDDNESFGKNDTGSISVGYQLTDEILVSLSYGTAFKAPTFNDALLPVTDFPGWWGPGTIYRFGGNVDLQPEKSSTSELMIRGTHNDVSWTLSYFETRIEDLIELDEVRVSPLLTVSGMFNVSEVLIRGGEFSAETSFGEWNGSLALSYSDPINQETDELLEDRSRGSADVELSRSWGDFSYAVNWHAQTKRYDNDVRVGEVRKLGGFNTVSMSASYDLAKDMRVALKIDNVFDKDYQLEHSFNTAGRTATLSFRYGF